MQTSHVSSRNKGQKELIGPCSVWLRRRAERDDQRQCWNEGQVGYEREGEEGSLKADMFRKSGMWSEGTRFSRCLLHVRDPSEKTNTSGCSTYTISSRPADTPTLDLSHDWLFRSPVAAVARCD